MLNFEVICILIKPSWRVEPLHRGQAILGFADLKVTFFESIPSCVLIKSNHSLWNQDLWFWEVVQFQSSQWKLLKLKVKTNATMFRGSWFLWCTKANMRGWGEWYVWWSMWTNGSRSHYELLLVHKSGLIPGISWLRLYKDRWIGILMFPCIWKCVCPYSAMPIRLDSRKHSLDQGILWVFCLWGKKKTWLWECVFIWGLALPAMYVFYPTLHTCAISCSFHSGVSNDARGVSKMHDPKNHWRWFNGLFWWYYLGTLMVWVSPTFWHTQQRLIHVPLLGFKIWPPAEWCIFPGMGSKFGYHLFFTI